MKQTNLQKLVMPWLENMPDAQLLCALTATAIGFVHYCLCMFYANLCFLVFKKQ